MATYQVSWSVGSRDLFTIYCRRGFDSVSDTTINLCGNIKSVKMHFSSNTKILGV